MSRRDQIEARLSAAFSPRALEVVDDSDSHIGHAGYQEGGQSHFNLVIRADAFAGKSRVARHRAVYQALGPELMREIHALAIDADA